MLKYTGIAKAKVCQVYDLKHTNSTSSPLSLTIQLIRGSSPACQEGHIPFALAHPVSSLVGKSGPLSRFDVLMVRWLALQLVIASEQASLGPVCHAMITGGLIRGNTSCHEEHTELDAKLTNQKGSKRCRKKQR